MSLETSDLEEGKYYHLDDGNQWIFRFKEMNGDVRCMYAMDTSGQYYKECSLAVSIGELRDATDEESTWLHECHVAGKFVQKNSSKKHLEIGDLEKDEIYHIELSDGREAVFVFDRQADPDRIISSISMSNLDKPYAEAKETRFYVTARKLRKAKDWETQWLMAAIKKGEWIDKEEFKQLNNKQVSKTMSKQTEKQMLAAALVEQLLGDGAGQVNKSIVARHDLPTITIPNDMTKKEAAEELKRQWEEEETVIDVARVFQGWKWQDVLVAVKLTAEEHFGWINAVQSFMNPPTEIQVVIDYVNGSAVKTTCFYGQFKVTALDAGVCNIGVSDGTVNITFHLKKKFKGEVERWYELIDNHLRTKSIYRGKSVSVTAGGSTFGDPCEFEIIETRPNDKIILNPKEKSILEQYCMLDLQERGKRTYLFHGEFGNGRINENFVSLSV